MSDQEVRDALARLERALEVGFARLGGRVDVVIQRLDQQDRRADDHAQQIANLDQRVDELERRTVSRTEFQRIQEAVVTRDDLTRQHATVYRVVGVIMGVLTLVTGVGTPLLTIALT